MNLRQIKEDVQHDAIVFACDVTSAGVKFGAAVILLHKGVHMELAHAHEVGALLGLADFFTARRELRTLDDVPGVRRAVQSRRGSEKQGGE